MKLHVIYHTQPVHYQTFKSKKNGVTVRHGHLSRIYFYFTPFLWSTLVEAMLYSSIRVFVVLSICNKSTTLWIYFIPGYII